MSIAVAVAKAGSIALAVDHQDSFGDLTLQRDNADSQRIQEFGTTLLTWTGHGIYQELLPEYLRKEKPRPLDDAGAVFRLFTGFWKKLRSDYSFVNDQGDDQSPFAQLDSSFLLINESGIYGVTSNMGVTRFKKYWAIGAGQEFALGAVHALYQGPDDAETLVRRAADAAVSFNAWCGGELTVRTVTAAAAG